MLLLLEPTQWLQANHPPSTAEFPVSPTPLFLFAPSLHHVARNVFLPILWFDCQMWNHHGAHRANITASTTLPSRTKEQGQGVSRGLHMSKHFQANHLSEIWLRCPCTPEIQVRARDKKSIMTWLDLLFRQFRVENVSRFERLLVFELACTYHLIEYSYMIYLAISS